ncbi:type VI secretion protein IcmF/TssM N-terminal domain-containing protein [Candidimonas nitroreducens]|uniref:SPOR domain-containing protein n=1 Tax=Candidimonas nitroreducens TaxID=683354 RepID=A0A225MCS4_9BURK|nr:type VI secretion protein IcmF/TssM N-terminal domain-containing protein [Candidimonas nitroreducens]OWT59105.1 hypothetical protein CEY11_13025 [Candidimonas nitroreducens]
MLKKLLVFLLWLIGLIALAMGCWIAGVYLAWPAWRWLLLFVGILVAAWLIVLLRRRWIAWRLRRRLAQPTAGTARISMAQVDRDWRAGVRVLQRSRLSRFGSPLYVLPWFIALGHDDAAKSGLLRRAAGGDPVHGRGDAPVLRWWLLRNGVILDPAESTGPDDAPINSQYWHRLMHWMLRTRRREPLNGLIITLDTAWLMQGSDIDLADAGRHLRQRLDQLTRVYNVRLPVYVVLTRCEEFPGFRAWGESLDPNVRDQPVGYATPGAKESADKFIVHAFQSIARRMLDLRILQGLHGQSDETAFSLPERLPQLAVRLDKLMCPAFLATPYTETPILGGLFLTASPGGADTAAAGWFTPELFDRLLPARRNAWQPIERWRQWHRILRHALTAGWLALCAIAAALVIEGYHVADQQLQPVAWPTPDAYAGGLSTDLIALRESRDSIQTFQSRRSWKTRWLPFQAQVDLTEDKLKGNYIHYYRSEVTQAQIDPLLTSSLPSIKQQDDGELLAAWAQTLVRRINLIDAALAHKDLSKLPPPGAELLPIFKSAGKTSLSLMDLRLIGDLYRHYLQWQPNTNVIQEERGTLRQTLQSLNLPERPISWVYSWVALQGYLAPVRMSDYWPLISTGGQPEVPAALTLPGERAVTDFLKQVGTATARPELWAQRRAAFEQAYERAALKSWHAFTVAFPYAVASLPDATARRTVLTALMGQNGPYRRLMHDLAELGRRIADPQRPAWLQLAMRLDNLSQLADSQKLTGLAGAMQSADVANKIGTDVLKKLGSGASLAKSLSYVGGDNAVMADLDAYRKGVQETIPPLLQGQGSAVEAAGKIWAFGHDPAVKGVPLIAARDAFQALRREIGGAAEGTTDPIWKLQQGPLDYALDYAGRSAACGLQSDWESSVLNSVQGVTDPVLVKQMLYGERGQVSTFMAGPVKNFIDRGAVRYEPRTVQGHAIALNGQFYAFANQTQLQQVGMLVDQRRSTTAQSEIAALTQQDTALEQQIAKLQTTSASVKLSTVPAQVNPDARVLPESVTLSTQCAAKTLTLENLNFPNSAVFPWSQATCGDTVLTIRIGGMELVKQWSGAQAFIEFLRTYASGQHRYTPLDFPDQASALAAAGVRYITLIYRQQGQAPLLDAYKQADTLAVQLQANKDRIASLNPSAGVGVAPPPPAAYVPKQIISACMGPVASGQVLQPEEPPQPAVRNTPSQTAAAAAVASGARPAATSRAKPKSAAAASAARPRQASRRAAPAESGKWSYSIQVGVFRDAEEVRSRLTEKGYKVVEEPFPMGDKQYTSVLLRGYPTREDAAAAAEEIGKLLNLKPIVIRRWAS